MLIKNTMNDKRRTNFRTKSDGIYNTNPQSLKNKIKKI